MKRISQLDGVRGLAILAVFLHHALRLKLLWMGVDLFFILSGFLITGILLSAKGQKIGSYFAHFYGRRARRILAPYLVTLILVGLVFGYGWLKHWYLYILLTNLLLPLHIERPEAFDPLWSLAVEEQFYLFWPFAVYFLSPRNLRWLALGLLGLAPALRGLIHFREHWAIYTLTPFRMDLMAVSALLCMTYRDHRERIERWGAAAGAGCSLTGVAGLLLLAHFGVSTYGNTRLGNVAIYECSLLATLGIMLWALSGYRVGLLQVAPLRYLGRISYTVYLVHLAVLTWFAARLPYLLAAGAGFAVSIAYASASWYLMEARLLHYGQRKKLASAAGAS